MTGLSVPLCSCDPGICWLCYGLYISPKSPIPRAFHKHYKQTNNKLEEENISPKYIIKR